MTVLGLESQAGQLFIEGATPGQTQVLLYSLQMATQPIFLLAMYLWSLSGPAPYIIQTYHISYVIYRMCIYPLHIIYPYVTYALKAAAHLGADVLKLYTTCCQLFFVLLALAIKGPLDMLATSCSVPLILLSDAIRQLMMPHCFVLN